jgi:hypothetical protein
MKNTLMALIAILAGFYISSAQAEYKESDVKTAYDKPATDWILQKYDTDHDGKLSDTEKAEWLKAIMEKWDTNKDGNLDDTEKEAWNKQAAANKAGGKSSGKGKAPKGKGGDKKKGDEGGGEAGGGSAGGE